MAGVIHLKKGSGINLSKDHGLRRVKVELTFDVDPSQHHKAHEFDVNVCGIEVSHKTGQPLAPQPECFCFYNNADSATGAMHHEADGGSIGDDVMTIDLGVLEGNALGIDEVAIFAEIYENTINGHHFGELSHCTLHLVNPDTGEEFARYQLDKEDSNAGAFQVGSLTRDADGHFHFHAVAVGFNKGLEDILEKYGLHADDQE